MRMASLVPISFQLQKKNGYEFSRLISFRISLICFPFQFTLNDMMDYCHDSENEIDDIANQVGMRMDLHILGFDHGEFCIAIKTGRAVVHVLKADPIVRNELIPLYHNSPFDTDGLAIPFLYSRFAWSIFYKGMIRLRSHQQFLIADEGVLKSVRNYCLKILSPVSRALKPLPASKRAGKMPTFGDDDVEMEERDDEGHGNTLGEGSQSDDEDDISEGLEEQSSTITVTAEDEARWKVRFPFFCESSSLTVTITPLIAMLQIPKMGLPTLTSTRWSVFIREWIRLLS